MANAIFSALLKFIGNLIGVFTFPIDTIVSTAFPNFSNTITNFNDMLDTLVFRCSRAVGNIFNILPPNTKNSIILYLGILIIIFTISLAVHAIIKIIEIIKAVKIW